MKVLRAGEMGFCFGVRRAIEMMEQKAKKGPIQSLGSIVHNKQVVQRLAEIGVGIVETVEGADGRVLAITSHGVGPDTVEKTKSLGLTIIDTTCPFVRKAQLAAKSLSNSGYRVYVYGDPDHPEVLGILGWTYGEGLAGTDPVEALRWLGKSRKIGILSQTTQSGAKFSSFVQTITEALLPEASEIRAINTICDATNNRQKAAVQLSESVDAVVVIGGRNSANTKHLAEICESAGVETIHIETADEIDPSCFKGMETVGVTAGASTPDWVIDEVIAKLEG